jgi:protein-L-isoaspartate O-methyltransferase
MPHLEQHFLADPEALAWIVAEVDVRPDDDVVELGAGAGTIAAALLRGTAPASLTLVELDAALADRLRGAFPTARVVAADWRAAWPTLPAADVLVVSLPEAEVGSALDAIAERAPRVAVVAVAAGRMARLPSGITLTASRPLPRTAFAPPQPFDGEAWVLRPSSRDAHGPPASR